MDLRRIDLNLLIAFEAIVAEASVSRAARRLHLSQSAMSHSLMRLREAFGDPILVRQGRHMEATPRALAALPEVRSLLSRIGRLFANGGRFDPAAVDRILHIGASDFAAATVLPEVVRRVRAEAPSMRLRISHAGRVDAPAMLRSGQLDLALGVFNSLTADLRSNPLIEDRYLCAMAADSASGPPATEEDYLAREHVNVLVQGDVLGLIDEALARRGKTRIIPVTVAHFSAALTLLGGTDLIYTGPAGVFRMYPTTPGLRTFASPVALPAFPTQMAWSARSDQDEGLRWIRGCITACVTASVAARASQ
jgi:DNA-binding transcriptional LysR family regulator